MSTLNDLYSQYAPDVYRFALGLCGDPVWAEDITSETFVRAIVSPTSIRAETAKAYLFTIARNLYLKAWHKARRFSPLEEGIATAYPSPDTIAEDREKLSYLLSALQDLPEVDRSAILLRSQDGLSYQEIAAALGISLSAAKVKVHRARIKLAKILEEFDL